MKSNVLIPVGIGFASLLGVPGAAPASAEAPIADAPSCTTAEVDDLGKAHQAIQVALVRARQAYSDDPGSPIALASFGLPTKRQVARVTRAMELLQLILTARPKFDCSLSANCLDYTVSDDPQVYKEAMALTPDSGPYVSICSRKADYEHVIAGGERPASWKLFEPQTPIFWRDPAYIVVHEYWHWLGWEDVKQINFGPIYEQYVDPAFINQLAAQDPTAAAVNPESYAQYVRAFF